jgi:hypothetical protein
MLVILFDIIFYFNVIFLFKEISKLSLNIKKIIIMSRGLVLSELMNDKKDIENNINDNIYNIIYKKHYNNKSDKQERLLKNNYKRLNIINDKIDNYRRL